MFVRALGVVAAVLIAGCSGVSTAPAEPQSALGARSAHGSIPIQHIVIVVQENRTTDNLFNGLPGANTVQSGRNSHGQNVYLQQELLTAPYTIYHTHADFETEYRNGGMDGFNLDPSKCNVRPSQCPPPDVMAYAYVPEYEVQPYFALAEQYTFADNMFATQSGPSFPGHQYLVSGTSTISDGSNLRASENPETRRGQATGGCDSPKGSSVTLIDENGKENQSTYPCFKRAALTDLLDPAGLSWRYYQEFQGAGLWNGLDAIEQLRDGKPSEYAANVVTPSAQFLTDVYNGYLADVTWITPSPKSSDHAGETDGTGPSWVASVVNAVGSSSYWSSTAIIVVWDDWGGWFDHVAPQQRNSFELGMRVPMMVISPYAKTGYVSHVKYEFGSILKFVEKTFGLGSLGTTDVDANDLNDCFNFNAKARPFKRIVAPYDASYFIAQPRVRKNPDDDE